MTNLVNHDSLFIVKDFVQNTIISYTEFVESCEVTGQCLWV